MIAKDASTNVQISAETLMLSAFKRGSKIETPSLGMFLNTAICCFPLGIYGEAWPILVSFENRWITDFDAPTNSGVYVDLTLSVLDIYLHLECLELMQKIVCLIIQISADSK